MVFAMVAIALSPKPVFSADAIEEIPELQILKEENESISRGLAQERPISEAPSNVYVITEEDLRNARDIPTVLRRIPGMEIMQVTGADFNVSVRGDNQLRANKLLVMVDGRSIYLDAQGEVFWKMIPVTIPEIKRIEVLKGPASALYGFNAFDGVINIITKSPEEMKGATLQFGGGEFGTITTSAIAAGTHNKFGYRLSYGHDQNNKWSNRDSLAFRSDKFNIHTNYNVTNTLKFFLDGGLNASNNYDGPIFDTIVFSQKPSLGYAYGGFEGPNFFIRGWWANLDQPFIASTNPLIRQFSTPVPVHNSAIGNTYNIDAQHALDMAGRNRITYGVNYRYNTFKGTRIDQDANEHRLGFYLQDELQITSNLIAVAGVRYDLHSEINPTFSPRVALLYTPIQDHTFRIAGTVGYRPPTIDETHRLALAEFRIPGRPTSIGILKGNPNLAPEQMISYEVGYQGWYLKHRLRTRVDLFFNHLSDLVGTRTLSVGNIAIFENGGNTPQGRGEADIYGGEAGLEFLITPWLTGFANFSYEEIGQTFSGRVQRGAPRFKHNWGLHAESDNGLTGDVLVHYYGATTYALDPTFQQFSRLPGGSLAPNGRVGSYVLLNLRGAYRFWHETKSGREAEVAVTAFNALNDQHKEHPLGEVISSLVMGWLTIRY